MAIKTKHKLITTSKKATGAESLQTVHAGVSFVLSTKTLPWRGFPLTLYTDGTQYALAVAVVSGVTATSKVFKWTGVLAEFGSDSARNYLSIKNNSGGSATVSSTVSIRGMKLAINANSELILVPVTITSPDATKNFNIGGQNLTVVCKNRQWYLAVGEF